MYKYNFCKFRPAQFRGARVRGKRTDLLIKNILYRKTVYRNLCTPFWYIMDCVSELVFPTQGAGTENGSVGVHKA